MCGSQRERKGSLEDLRHPSFVVFSLVWGGAVDEQSFSRRKRGSPLKERSFRCPAILAIRPTTAGRWFFSLVSFHSLYRSFVSPSSFSLCFFLFLLRHDRERRTMRRRFTPNASVCLSVSDCTSHTALPRPLHEMLAQFSNKTKFRRASIRDGRSLLPRY